jgi:acyl-coenzyme A thioesterase PaaI-like protein
VIEERFRPAAEFAITSIEGIKRTGIKLLEMKERYAKLLMPLEGNVNHINMMYAGSLFTIGEINGGIIHVCSFDVHKYVPIVKEINIRFRRPAFTDITVEVSMEKEEADRIQKEAAEKGKADFEMELELKDTNGEVVSIVKGIWQIRKMPEGMEAPFPKT